jgi:hypothetical protein
MVKTVKLPQITNYSVYVCVCVCVCVCVQNMCRDKKFLNVSKVDNFNTCMSPIVIGKIEKKTVVNLA